jgi:cytochrome c oxidase subunit II
VNRVAADNPVGIDRSDPDAKDDIVSTNQLTLPVDRPVVAHLSSQDVIHSFGVPQMRVKQDTVPGLSIPVWFIPNKVGDYEIACSQLCGLGHFRMRAFVSIKSDAEYRNFLAEEAKALAQ